MKIMAPIILIALQILYLLLKAHFDGSSDQKQAREAMKKAQSHLDELAQKFEARIRYENPPQEEVDRLLDQMDQNTPKEGKLDETTPQ